MYLLDTNVISELRRRDKAHPSVRAWADATPSASVFMSAISILEIEMGVLRIERRDAAQGAVLRSWLERHVLPRFEGRILGVDTAVARTAAHLHVPDPRSDRDALIAATARVHHLTVVTRDVSDFAPLGVAILNPWSDDSSSG